MGYKPCNLFREVGAELRTDRIFILIISSIAQICYCLVAATKPSSFGILRAKSKIMDIPNEVSTAILTLSRIA